MTRQLNYIFPAGEATAVCNLQTLLAAGNLLLNGKLANTINSEVNFLNHGFSRSITITSVNNLTGITFTIIGYQNGVLITNVLNGPNAATAYGAQIYDKIVSITTNGAAAAVSIGTGHSGFFPLINIDLNRIPINYSLSTQALTDESINTTIYNVYDDITKKNVTFLDQAENNPTNSLFVLKNQSADESYEIGYQDILIYRSFLIHIEGDPTTIDNSIEVNFIQS